jgi:segregation and condensation protein B
MNTFAQIESILFVASKPLTIKKIAQALDVPESHVEEQVENLQMKYNREESGIHVLVAADTVQMATNPAHASVIDGFIKHEVASELTRAQLETFTVIGYCGPMTKPEIEQIRGVNCAIILRNLLMRGLIMEMQTDDKLMPSYVISQEGLRHLGVTDVTELPDYDVLRSHEYLRHVLGLDPLEEEHASLAESSGTLTHPEADQDSAEQPEQTSFFYHE